MGIIAWIVFGLIAGAIAKAIMPGRDGGGFIMTTLLGIMASLIDSAALNLVEKGEAELAAECVLLVARVEDGDAPAR